MDDQSSCTGSTSSSAARRARFIVLENVRGATVLAMRGKSARFWVGLVVCVVVVLCGLVASIWGALTYPDTWGTDFWQKVLISFLGTLGSLVVALVVFLLT